MQYALLDVVQVGYTLDQVKSLASLWLSLYRGPADAQQEEMAPCLAGYTAGDSFDAWWRSAQSDSVGIGIEAEVPPNELRTHLRRFLLVELEGENRKVYFRYYDPTILRTFLPTCDEAQLNTFFGPIKAFQAADVDAGQVLRFTNEPGKRHWQPLTE
ncbi:DUF4123 domain-containing protein [Fibrella arboris]|uniref:DUF4123 domain-containing protein n=1 Tax=Fibrella arboris TaxID=3242486 RepID=UPI003520C71F